MEIDQLRYMIAIADYGSFTAASKILYISQPSLSQSINKLEEELGTNIFIRCHSGVKVTVTGENIIKKAKNILYQFEELQNFSTNNNNLVTGSISISVLPSFCMTLLPKTMKIFKSKFPKIQVNIIECGSNKSKELISSNSVNFSFVSCRSFKEYENIYVFKPLIELTGNLVAIVGKNSVLANKKLVSFKDIFNNPIAILNSDYRMHNHIIPMLEKYGKPNIFFKTGNFESLKRLVIEGICIGFFSNFALKNDPYVKLGIIIPIKIEEQKKQKTYYGVIHSKKNVLSYPCKEFINIFYSYTKKCKYN